MPISANDITYLYSGGVGNSNPNLSLGGQSSEVAIANNILFDNVSVTESLVGMTDYRCIYLKNNNLTNSFYNVEIFVYYTVEGQVTAQLGFLTQNDRQNVYVTHFSNISGGSITLTYNDISSHNFTFSYNANVNVFATNLQSAINAISGLEDVIVSGSVTSNTLLFELNFIGQAGARYHQPLVVASNNLAFSGSQPVISTVKAVDGGPVNLEAVEIDNEKTSPTGVYFSDQTYTVPDLKPQDIVPIWIKRTVPSNTTAMETDGFIIRVRGSTVLI